MVLTGRHIAAHVKAARVAGADLIEASAGLNISAADLLEVSRLPYLASKPLLETLKLWQAEELVQFLKADQ
jgi:hypothetical protein